MGRRVSLHRARSGGDTGRHHLLICPQMWTSVWARSTALRAASASTATGPSSVSVRTATSAQTGAPAAKVRSRRQGALEVIPRAGETLAVHLGWGDGRLSDEVGSQASGRVSEPSSTASPRCLWHVPSPSALPGSGAPRPPAPLASSSGLWLRSSRPFPLRALLGPPLGETAQGPGAHGWPC